MNLHNRRDCPSLFKLAGYQYNYEEIYLLMLTIGICPGLNFKFLWLKLFLTMWLEFWVTFLMGDHIDGPLLSIENHFLGRKSRFMGLILDLGSDRYNLSLYSLSHTWLLFTSEGADGVQSPPEDIKTGFFRSRFARCFLLTVISFSIAYSLLSSESIFFQSQQWYFHLVPD